MEILTIKSSPNLSHFPLYLDAQLGQQPPLTCGRAHRGYSAGPTSHLHPPPPPDEQLVLELEFRVAMDDTADSPFQRTRI
jgi:hypothetical protein